MIAAAGCDMGRVLAGALSGAGARLVVLDADPERGLALARMRPERIEAVTLDALHPEHCRRLGAIWDDTPLDLLVHLQVLRAPQRPGAAIAAIPALTRALLPGLARGQGQVIMIYRAPAPRAQAEDRAYDTGLTALAGPMQGEVGARATVNALRLGSPRAGTSDAAAIWRAISALVSQQGAGPRGSVLHLGAE